jgi:hypothetical protein
MNSHETTPNSSHPADMIASQIRNKEHKRLLYINACREQVFQKYQTSLQKLRIYSKTDFIKKETWGDLFIVSEKEE